MGANGGTLVPFPAQTAADHTFMRGGFEATIVDDGNFVMPTPLLALNAKPDELQTAITAAGQSGARVEPSGDHVCLS